MMTIDDDDDDDHFINVRANYNNSANVQNRKLKCGGTVGAGVTL